MDPSLYGDITFADVEANVRIDIPACSAEHPDFVRYCQKAWHEIIHTYPGLQRYFDPVAGTITQIPEDAPDDAEAFPITMNGRRIPIEALVRSLVDYRSALKPEQLARLKVDDSIFNSEQGINPAK